MFPPPAYFFSLHALYFSVTQGGPAWLPRQQKMQTDTSSHNELLGRSFLFWPLVVFCFSLMHQDLPRSCGNSLNRSFHRNKVKTVVDMVLNTPHHFLWQQHHTMVPLSLTSYFSSLKKMSDMHKQSKPTADYFPSKHIVKWFVLAAVLPRNEI